MSDKLTDFYLIVKKTKFDALKDGLTLLDEDKLRKMAAYWLGSEKAMIHPENEVRSELADAMGDTEKTAHIFDRMPKRSYDLFNYLVSEGGQLPAAELAKNFMGGKVNSIRTHLDPLLHRGLVWECRSSAKAADTARFFTLNTAADTIELPSYLEGKLGTVLPHRSNDQIKAFARAFGADLKKVRTRNDQTAWLRTEVRNPTCFRHFFDSCNANERKLLKILALHDDGLHADELIHQYSLFTNGEPEAELRDALHHLFDELGLIDTYTETIGHGRHKQSAIIFRLPSELNLMVRSNFKQKFKDKIPPITRFESPDEDFALGSHGKERPTIWIDFQQLLNHLIRCEVGVIRKGGMHKKNLKRILDRLESEKVDAYLYLDFLFLYAHHQEILFPEGERWAINVDRIRPVQSATAFYRDFWGFYFNNGSWNDRDSSPLQGVIQKGESDSIFALRRALLRQLGDCPAGEWIEMESFFDELCDREMAFRSGEAPFVSSDPLKEKFRFMKSTMERSLRWIGLLDTTTVPNQRINLFRLTEIGRWLLSSGRVESPFEEAAGEPILAIQPNLEVHVPAHYPLERQLALARFTDDQKGRIILNRASARRGLNAGMGITEMLDFLSRESQSELPPNAQHMLEEVEEKINNIMIGGEPIRIEVNNHSLLDELVQGESFGGYIQERSSERRALLRHDADLKKLMEELRLAGYSPRWM